MKSSYYSLQRIYCNSNLLAKFIFGPIQLKIAIINIILHSAKHLFCICILFNNKEKTSSASLFNLLIQSKMMVKSDRVDKL